MDYMGAVKDSRNACQPGVMVQNFVKDGQAIVGGGNIINNRNDGGPNTTAAPFPVTTDADLTPRPRVSRLKPVPISRVQIEKHG